MSNGSRTNFCYLSKDAMHLYIKAGILKNHFASCHHFTPLSPNYKKEQLKLHRFFLGVKGGGAKTALRTVLSPLFNI